MPATSSGRIIKTRKGKKGTAHQKNHRWESFATKISKLNSLDLLRRVRRHDIEAEDISTNTSYLKAGLEKWQELNMSEQYITFAHEILPMCDSLPQILHFEEKIMEIMVTYIEKKEMYSLEPLLELMTDFAHDLGTRFEKHYAKALALVTTIAATANSQDVEVIEWSFNCLAFMFKYLSKLLVPDLRPTYDLMAPLLGKHCQKPHIARFAAEALSFLIKKAGAPAHKTALPLIVQHAKKDLQSIFETREFGLYYHGLMTLFAEAMKGNGLSVHTSGPSILEALILALDEDDLSTTEDLPWMNVICGVITSIIHHSSSDTFEDVLDVILERANASADLLCEQRSIHALRRALLSARTIGIVAGVRKGTRIRDWSGLLKTISNILRSVSTNGQLVMQSDQTINLWGHLILSVSITFQYSPMDAMIPFISNLMDSLIKDPLAKCFLAFCSFFSEAEPGRFSSIALPYFQRFIVAHWSDSDNGDTLCVLLPKMVSSGVLPSRHGKGRFPLPQSWQDQIVSKFEGLEVKPFPEQASAAVYDRDPKKWEDRCLPKYNALLEVLECTMVHPSTNARIAEILLRKLKLALRPNFSLAPEEAHFIVGRGFIALSRMIRGAGEADRSLKPLLRAKAPDYARLPNFLEALLTYETSLVLSPGKTASKSSTEDSILDPNATGDPLITSLISNLSTSSRDLRLFSLRLLEHIHNADYGSTSEALSTMIMVEQTPLDLQSARSASMHIRRLATLFLHQPENSWLKEAIPSFCFGMFTVKFAQIWEDASATLKQISDVTDGENLVAALAFKWLKSPLPQWDGSAHNLDEQRNGRLTDFECSNLMKLNQLAKEAVTTVQDARVTMLQKFAAAQQLVDDTPPTARSQALRVLSANPSIAEKRSRELVPMFLSWASKYEEEDDKQSDSKATQSDWTRKDQKAQLDLFGLFTNSRSLYKSAEVYDALLDLLGNGDIEIQKSALNAIFTWKNGSIKPYEENLLNLLDEARFKEEIAILLQGQSLVQPEHRADLMPVLLRLLYGRAISRKGAASGKQGLGATRLTVLRNLGPRDIEGFLDVTLANLRNIHLIVDGEFQEPAFKTKVLSVRKQVGFVNMTEVVLKELGTKVIPFTRKLLDAVLYCLIQSSRQLKDDIGEAESESNQPSQISMLRAIRQTALKCLILLFTNSENFEWSPYIASINREVVLPRLENLPIETAQGISGILRLFYTWSLSPQNVLLLGADDNILSKVAECISTPKSKDEVKLFALSIIRNVLKLSQDDVTTSAHQGKGDLLTLNMDHFLTQIGGVLRSQHDISKDLLEGCVETVSELAPFVSTSTQAHNLVDVSIFLLDQPSRRVNPKTKGGLLQVLERFVPLYDLQNDVSLKDKVYDTVTSLFGFFKDKASRQVLSKVLMVYSEKDPVISEVARLCIDLNSFAEGRLDEPDYDRRLRAFNAINIIRETSFTARQWTPLLYNMMYYIRYDEEFGILSSNSSDGLCRFIDTAGAAEQGPEQTGFLNMLSNILLPAIYSGVREQSEVIRREYVKVMAHLVRTFSTWPEVHDMHSLLAGEDELESSFFNNILTAGKGRQSSALSQVSAVAERGELSGKNVSHFFIPLIEHFIFDRAEGSEAHNLAAEATTTVGILSGSLEWPQYRAMLKRFIGYVEAKPDLEKQIIRLLGRVIDALALGAEAILGTEAKSTPIKRSTLTITMPRQQKLADDLTTNILPPLTAYLHDKNEYTVSLRVPVAIIVVKLLKLLPQEQLTERLPAVLTDICHIFRSKAQEARDLTRDTLTKICVLLGASCFGFVLKELRGALARGSQLHVLSYTMHSILVAVTPEYAPGDLDYCLPSIVAIIMDDIFGATGQEKDADEYVSKMKEVKSSKSHDSMELIAKTATLSRLTDLVRPIQVLLKEKLNLRTARKIDELLNRISTGLLKNSAAQSRDSLTFCWEVIQDIYKGEKPQGKVKDDYRLKKYLMQKGAKKGGDRGSTTVYTYKLVRFAFDVLRSVLKKYDSLRTPGNLAAFIPILGDAVVQAEEEVKVSAFRLLTTIVKVPLKPTSDGTDLYRVAASEATKSISASSATASDISQAALKLISVILRDRKDVPVKDTAVDELLTKLKEDMTEPERRHVTFNFLRAVMDAKIETAVIYDILDYVGTVMVTNDDKDTRDLARGAYFQFLRDYPQKKSRWTKQLRFIVANLKYEREGGRLSILEVIHLLLSKSSHEFVQEVSATCFVPLIFVLANDDSEKCRMAAGELIKETFRKGDRERTSTFLTLLRTWINQSENSPVVRLALQTYGFYYESQTTDTNDLDMLLQCIISTLQTAENSDSDWEQIFAALQLTHVLVQKFPEKLLSSNSPSPWVVVRRCLSFPHAWVKESSSKLIGSYFADFARNNAEAGLQGLPLSGSGGLKLKPDDILDLTRRTANLFKTPGLSAELAQEVVKNLVFLGLVAGTNGLSFKSLHDAEESDDGETESDSGKKSALQYLLGRLSFILRKETSPPRAPGLIPKTAALTLLEKLISGLDSEILIPCLPTILLPLHNLNDTSIPVPYSTDDVFKTNFESLRSNAEGLMETTKRKVGTKAYSEALLAVRKGVMERRNVRSGKRKIEAISAPERYGEQKRKKGERKRERRKEKGQEHGKRRKEQ